MAHSKLADRLITEEKTPAVARWLCEQFDRIINSAPSGVQERNATEYRVQLGLALEAYRAHRQEGDPERTTTHSSLLKWSRECLVRLQNDLNSNRKAEELIPYPATQQMVENSVTQLLASGDWLRSCHGCGNFRRGLRVVDGRGVCAACLPKHTITCTKCEARHFSDAMRRVRNNEQREEDWFCEKCWSPGQLTKCTNCGGSFCGEPAENDSISAEELKRDYRSTLCYLCIDEWIKMECGHASRRGYKIYDIPNVEDDKRLRDEVRDSSTLHVCEKCYHEQRSGNIEHFGAKKNAQGKRFKEVGSERTYGVELEMVQVRAMKPMPERMKQYWTSKHDASLPETGVEMASGILKGDEGLAIIKDLCDYGRQHKWSVNAKAGFHLHVGLVNETPEQVTAVALGYLCTYDLWAAFVSPSRTRSKYCRRNRALPKDMAGLEPNKIIYSLTTGEHPEPSEARRVWCNWLSYTTRATIEIRSHHATLDYQKVSNWVKSHTRFVDWCVGMGTAKAVFDVLFKKDVRQQFLFLSQVAWKDRELARWYRGRAETLHGPLSKLLPSHRKLRKAGIDPKALPKKSDEIVIDGRVAYVRPAMGIWVITSAKPGESIASGTVMRAGKWGDRNDQFLTEGDAWRMARLWAERERLARIEPPRRQAPPAYTITGIREAEFASTWRRYANPVAENPVALEVGDVEESPEPNNAIESI